MLKKVRTEKNSPAQPRGQHKGHPSVVPYVTPGAGRRHPTLHPKASHVRSMVFCTDAAIHRPDAEGYVSRMVCPPSRTKIEEQQLSLHPKGKPCEIHGVLHRGGDTPPRCRRLCLSVWSALPIPALKG
jgi:hypothetical protein